MVIDTPVFKNLSNAYLALMWGHMEGVHRIVSEPTDNCSMRV